MESKPARSSGNNSARYTTPNDDEDATHRRPRTNDAASQKPPGEIALAVLKRVRRLMWERVGITRTRAGLWRAVSEFEQIGNARLRTVSRNFLSVATLVARAALWREESRGGHFRDDFPRQDDVHWQVHSIQQRDREIASCATMDFEKSTSVQSSMFNAQSS